MDRMEPDDPMDRIDPDDMKESIEATLATDPAEPTEASDRNESVESGARADMTCFTRSRVAALLPAHPRKAYAPDWRNARRGVTLVV